MRIKWLAAWLLPKVRKIAAAREPDFRVMKKASLLGGKGPDHVYMRRWWLVRRNDWLNVYLHNMVRDDDADLHDHSYWSVSLVLSEGLREVHVEEAARYHLATIDRHIAGALNSSFSTFESSSIRIRYPQPGDLVVRSPRMAHQLQVLPGSDPWTIFVTGPRVRDWGFWCPRRWRRWDLYVDAQSKDGQRGTGTSGVGIGCGEDQ